MTIDRYDTLTAHELEHDLDAAQADLVELRLMLAQERERAEAAEARLRAAGLEAPTDEDEGRRAPVRYGE